ncbi:MAG: ABC transporter ATP-binding protein [Anaerolineaceae bacterium]|nr:ABC transporter ATP-binding protein [Anaerolineaceae bacterium]
MSPTSAPVIVARDLHRVFQLGGETIHAVNGVSLEILPERITAVIGRSGSGKTTLINLLSGLDDPSEGEVVFDSQPLAGMNYQARLQLRRDKIGFVFQTFGLLPLLSAAENVSIPLRITHLSHRERETRIMKALEWVGLGERAHHRPYELSGGEQQRVAIARALVAQPKVILADEPTGQLDSRTGRNILNLLRRLVEERHITLVIVTHDPQVMQEADIVHEMRDGRLIATHTR